MNASGEPKQFMLLAGKPVLAWTIEAFRSVAPEADIVVALPAAHVEAWKALTAEHNVPAHRTCTGGSSRFHSVRRALEVLDADCAYIAVHDAARPLVSAGLIVRAIETAHEHGTAIPVVPLVDSIRRITVDGPDGYARDISHPEDRSALRAVQTPQIFRADILRVGYEAATSFTDAADETPAGNFTDDAGVVEAAGYSVVLCEGERRNIKITEPADIAIAEAMLARD
jgi:2-C-methyl-D-erythritol 4-phosphate cytidylyltransferase